MKVKMKWTMMMNGEKVSPAWSEEDEAKLKSACALIRNTSLNGNESVVDSTIDWLRTLKDRRTWKPSDEEMKTLLRTEYEKGRADVIAEFQKAWSEEDDVKVNRIVGCLENLNVADNDILLKDVDWLKSLKPQNTWKPSDEQMIILQEAIGIVGQLTPRGECLKELVEQLKKLKGY